MGIISSTVSVCRYHIEGTFEDSVMEKVKTGLLKHTIPGIESEYDEVLAGWTSYENPYSPDFETDSFIFGRYFVFSMRIDKKNVPLKLVKKHMALEAAKKKEKTNRNFLSKNEKSELKGQVVDMLMRKMPSIPSTYDILWDYEAATLYFFSTQKAANEFFQTLFLKSFDLNAISIFPYTMIEKRSGFSASEKDKMFNLSLIKYSR